MKESDHEEEGEGIGGVCLHDDPVGGNGGGGQARSGGHAAGDCAGRGDTFLPMRPALSAASSCISMF